MLVGGVPVDRRVFASLEPRDVLDIAEAAIQGKGDGKALDLLVRLNPELTPERLRLQLCFNPLVEFLRGTIEVKKWPRDVRLRLEEILIGYDPAASYATYDCPHFRITYQDSGSDQPPTSDTGASIVMPGTGAVVGTTVAGNGVPDYIEKLCFWLENALATYTNPPFSLRNPAAGGLIPVNVTGTAPGSAVGGSMTIGRNLNDDLLAAVPTHELMHLIQELYRTAGSGGGWNPGMTEGGAVLGEDVVFDTHNRYIVQATLSGTLASPATSLNDPGGSTRYYLALFLKYISEQQSSRVGSGDEPAIGVETYRALLEKFDTDTYTNAAIAAAVADLPWYQSFNEIGYLDPARLDETSSETLLGNFWLACYLKDLGTTVPDRRFDFMEDEESATWDTIFLSMDSVSTLGGVNLTANVTLNASGTLTLSSGTGASVAPFAARFYKVAVASGVDTLRVDFTAGAGFTRPLIQIALIEPGNVVRDILRSDRTTWSRTIANARSGVNLDHILVVVAGTDVGGPLTLTVREVAPAPDVMVTRWHHAAGKHYEIDSFNWAWTWVSPDIWVDNDGTGPDSEVFFNTDNKLFIRLRNQGHAAASGIGVDFWYQDASGGLSDGGWQPVRNTGGTVQSLSGLTLAAGASNQWFVNWSPAPSGTSNHFCVRAVVTVPGDPNVDNKRCLSNFGNVHTAYFADLAMVRRLPEEFALGRERIDVILRARGRWFVSPSDVAEAEARPVRHGQEVVDTFRLRRRARLTAHEHAQGEHEHGEVLRGHLCQCSEKLTPQVRRPDPFAHYPTDPEALPPGLGDVPLVTIAHVVDGRPVGGFTWAIREKETTG